MRTRAKRKYAAGGRARREHVPEHMLFYLVKETGFSDILLQGAGVLCYDKKQTHTLG